MYNGFFGFTERPFASVPRVDQYYPAATIEAARTTLARCIERSEGAGMVVGPSGTGKTLLCQVLAEQFRHSLQVARLSSGRLGTQRALWQAILYELGRPYRGMDEGELRLALVDYLTLSPECPHGMLLLVDEAHTLPLRLLEEIRTLTNLARDDQPRVRLVVAGNRVLEERFASPKLESFAQRLVARCYLEALNRTETEQYIRTRIHAVGGAAEGIFPEAACQSVYRATDGVPRLINQVCDHALLLACAGGWRQLEPAHIEEAWADLQQLPTPSSGESPGSSPAESVVEFGGLDDLSEESAPPPAAQHPAQEEGLCAALPTSQETDDMNTSFSEPADRLESIQRMLTEAGDNFRPAGSIGPEVELIFDEPDHPFGEKFAHEEVVVDRYGPPSRPEQALQRVQAGGASALGRAQAAVARDEEPETVPLRRQQAAETAEPSDDDMIILEDEYDDRPSPATCPIVAVRRQEYGQLFARLRRGRADNAGKVRQS